MSQKEIHLLLHMPPTEMIESYVRTGRQPGIQSFALRSNLGADCAHPGQPQDATAKGLQW